MSIANEQDDTYDPNEPLEEDLTEDDEEQTLPCPSCGHPVHEETQKCPYCGDWIVPLPAAGRKHHWVWLAAAALAILGLLFITLF